MAISEQNEPFVHPLIKRIEEMNRSKPVEVKTAPAKSENLPMRLYNILIGRQQKLEGEQALELSTQAELAQQEKAKKLETWLDTATKAAKQAITFINDPKHQDAEAVGLRKIVPDLQDVKAIEQDVLEVLETFPADKPMTPDAFINYYRDVLSLSQNNLTPRATDTVRAQPVEAPPDEATMSPEKRKWIEVRMESAKKLFFTAGYAEFGYEHTIEYLDDLYEKGKDQEPSPISVKLYIEKVKQEKLALRDRLRGIEDRADDNRFVSTKR